MWEPDPPEVQRFQSFLDWLRQKNYREHFERWLNTQTFEEELPSEAREKVLPILREAFSQCGDDEAEFWDFVEKHATEKDPVPFFTRKVPFLSRFIIGDILRFIVGYYHALRTDAV